MLVLVELAIGSLIIAIAAAVFYMLYKAVKAGFDSNKQG